MVIKAIIHHSKTQNVKLNNLLDKIHLLLGNFRSYKIYHVLRELNERADVEANKGVLLALRNLKVNGTFSSVEIPRSMRADLHTQKSTLKKQQGKKGKAIRVGHVRAMILGRGDKVEYHGTTDFRQGGDRESTRPYLMDLTNRVEIMNGKEGGNKSEATPQSQAIHM